MKDFLAKEWEETLRRNGLAHFDAFWNLDAPWFEELNERLGGWSGVSRIELEDPDGAWRPVFLKRQCNHTRRSFRPPWFKIATGEREMRNLLRFRSWGIPTVEPIYFGQRRVRGEFRVVLATESLEGYRSLDAWSERIAQQRLTGIARSRLVKKTAEVVRNLHATGFEHGNLRGRHVLASLNGKRHDVDVRLIDLEGVRRHPKRRMRDLVKLFLNTSPMHRTDTLRFCRDYLEAPKVNEEVRALWHRIARGAEIRRAKKLARWQRKQAADRG
jgi:hypothetical protein